MILETIFLWTGWVLLMLIMMACVVGLLYWVSNKLFYQWITFKSLIYVVMSETRMYKKNKDLLNQIDFRLGRQWYITLKGKSYLWEIVKVEDKNDTRKKN